MGTIIDKAYVKTNFRQYDKYFLDENNEYSDDVLDNEIDLAEVEYSKYYTVAEADVQPTDKFNVLIITKKRGFDIRHGDTEFENKPQILKDYDNLIKEMNDDTDGLSSSDTVSITAKPRRFGTNGWFNETGEDNDTSTGLGL